MKKLTIIGSGPAGYTAAFAAARAGHAVTLVESEAIGGVCLNSGCIPTKTFKSSADLLDKFRHMGEFAITGSPQAAIDMARLLERKTSVIRLLAQGLEKSCAHLNVAVVRGRGHLVSARQVLVTARDGSVQPLDGDAVILAVGSRPMELSALPTDRCRILTSDDALNLDHVPASICIVGGGVIGCEMACIFRAFGAEVTVIEGQGRLLPLPSIDEEISKLLQREMKKAGIRVETGVTVSRAEVGDGIVRLHTAAVGSARASVPLKLEVESVLVTVGRVPDTMGLGLDTAGVACDPRGWVQTDAFLETSVPGVYAIGDILGPEKIMLAHMAAVEAECAVANLGQQPFPCDYSLVPSAIFTTPEIGCVGLTEAQALALGRNVRCVRLHVRELGKAHAMGEIAGLFKLVVDAESETILGAHICGPHATDLVAEAALAIHMGASVEDVACTIHAHPTLAEGFGDLCRIARLA
jgi:dihydrolipoamide dehydrogenase